MKLVHAQSPRKYGTGLGSNSRLLDLQTDMYLQSDTLDDYAMLCFTILYYFPTLVAHENMMKNSPASYPYLRSEIKTSSIASVQ